MDEAVETIQDPALGTVGLRHARSADLAAHGYHLAPEIPDRKLANACQAYARVDFRRETPLLLFDDTVFGSGKRGFLLTTRALHYAVTDAADGLSLKTGRVEAARLRGFRVHADALWADGERLGLVSQPPAAVVAVLEALFEQLAPPAPPAGAPPEAPAEAFAATLRTLKGLVAEGLLTEAEFLAKKQELLARL